MASEEDGNEKASRSEDMALNENRGLYIHIILLHTVCSTAQYCTAWFTTYRVPHRAHTLCVLCPRNTTSANYFGVYKLFRGWPTPAEGLSLDQSLVADYQMRLSEKRREVANLQRQKEELQQMQEKLLALKASNEPTT